MKCRFYRCLKCGQIIARDDVYFTKFFKLFYISHCSNHTKKSLCIRVLRLAKPKGAGYVKIHKVQRDLYQDYQQVKGIFRIQKLKKHYEEK